MVKTFEAEAVEPINLEDFFGELDRVYDPSFSDSFISAAARLLQRLSSNRLLLIEHVQQYGGPFEFAASVDTPQSFIFERRDPFVLRVNVWKPLSAELIAAGQRKIHSYDLDSYHVGHNHNFRFLTVGHLGPGYDTELCEVDPAAISGIPGEPVELRFHRRENLSEGRVLYFRPFVDVHEQHPPSALSISINLVLSLDSDSGEQYEFNIREGTLLGPVARGADDRVRACIRFAQHLADAETDRILRDLAERASTSRVRSEALRATHGLRAFG